MATKINKNLENSFVFTLNEMQQAAFEGAKTKWDIKNDNEDELNNNLDNYFTLQKL